ncbi:hypothetical protein KL86DPRO_10548 [uncultured delta proteobacterium]|uniref:Uncharacterized protein n=1 Tax=uncultured delta proteobacterium TaxID=34034 RepID=A0A212J2E8_9DELT|nr:hypothetical protein KL86DPRO_10548 [uncultured delta proteobacterium]
MPKGASAEGGMEEKAGIPRGIVPYTQKPRLNRGLALHVTIRLVARLAGGFGLGFVYLQVAAVHAGAVKGLDGAGSVGISHFHETETTGAARFTVSHQVDGVNGAILGEKVTNLIFRRRPGQVAHINRLAHKKPRLKKFCT